MLRSLLLVFLAALAGCESDKLTSDKLIESYLMAAHTTNLYGSVCVLDATDPKIAPGVLEYAVGSVHDAVKVLGDSVCTPVKTFAIADVTATGRFKSDTCRDGRRLESIGLYVDHLIGDTHACQYVIYFVGPPRAINQLRTTLHKAMPLIVSEEQ